MWFSVLLRGRNGNVKKEVPFGWIRSVDVVQIFNRGINRTKNYLIFYSKDKTDEPSFKLAVQHIYDETDVRGCYYAKIRNTTGEYFFIVDWPKTGEFF